MVKNTVAIPTLIAEGSARMGLELPPEAPARLADFVALLARWNRVYNLTAVRLPEDMAVRHVLDSLAILPWLAGPRILDVGSGAGLPGIPLAVVRPEFGFYLLDSSAKRTRFLTQAALELGLANVTVVRVRAEDYRPERPFASVVSRAFGSLAQMVACAGDLCAADGRLLAMKGACPEAELAALSARFELVDVYVLKVPGLDAERHLVHLAPVGRKNGGKPSGQAASNHSSTRE